MQRSLRHWFLLFAAFSAAATPVIAAERGARETLACRLGTEDRHARIAVVLVGGKTTEFAYYSKWKPRTCSIYLQRNRDPYSKWADNGHLTTVNLERGVVLIEHKKGVYRFDFRDIDRERYCGMDGKINGYLIIKKGSDQCELAGVMEEGTPLGNANPSNPDEPVVTPLRSQQEASAGGAGGALSNAATKELVGPPGPEAAAAQQ